MNGITFWTGSRTALVGETMLALAGQNAAGSESTLQILISAIEANQSAISALQSGKRAKPTRETFAVSSWSEVSDVSPYTHAATVTVSASIGNDTLVELINDNAVKFATYGFAIAAVSGQSVTIYSVGEPSESVSLTLEIGG